MNKIEFYLEKATSLILISLKYVIKNKIEML